MEKNDEGMCGLLMNRKLSTIKENIWALYTKREEAEKGM